MSNFKERKEKILKQLNAPAGEYTDLSPKGSVDERIRDLIEEVNSIPGLVTTSSCAGRISVFLEGKKKSASSVKSKNENENESENGELPEEPEQLAIAGPGGKGGGRWLLVSHDPLDLPSGFTFEFHDICGLRHGRKGGTSVNTGAKLIHFKFEPMILHILSASLEDANAVLTASNQAGFRESGAMNLSLSSDGTTCPMIAVRSMGLAFDSIVGYESADGVPTSLVDEAHLAMLVSIANARFKTNSERIQRFRAFLTKETSPDCLKSEKPDWEDAVERKRRKKLEGIATQLAQKKPEKENPDDMEMAGILDDFNFNPESFVA